MQCLNPFIIGYGNSATPSGDYLAIGSAADWIIACPSLGGNFTISNPGDSSNVISITPAGAVSLGSLALTTALPVSSGGTGSSTQNFVDLSSAQASIGGAKTFTQGCKFSTSLNLSGHLNQTTAGVFGGVLTLASGTVSKTFTNAFTSTPIVLITPIGAPSSGATIYLSAVSATAFTVTSTNSSDTRTLNWYAMGNPN
jgi:hypothetical protein